MRAFVRQIRCGIPALTLALALLLQGCESATEPPLRVTFDATVHRVLLEGPDTFVLRNLETEETYFPVNLPPEFQVGGARVRVEGLLSRDSQVLLVPTVEILSIIRL